MASFNEIPAKEIPVFLGKKFSFRFIVIPESIPADAAVDSGYGKGGLGF